MTQTTLRAVRPLSPHLQIYRPMLTMMMSIAHRLTGAAMYVGTLLMVFWLMALAAGPEMFQPVNGFLHSIFGRVLLLLYTWALLNHMLGGVRHLVWDTGRGFSKPAIELAAQATLIGGIVLTALVWIAAYLLKGAAA